MRSILSQWLMEPRRQKLLKQVLLLLIHLKAGHSPIGAVVC